MEKSRLAARGSAGGCGVEECVCFGDGRSRLAVSAVESAKVKLIRKEGQLKHFLYSSGLCTSQPAECGCTGCCRM